MTGVLAPLFSDPFFSGTVSSSPLVPLVYDVAINGRGYMIDTSGDFANFRGPVSVPVARTQADTGDKPGAQSLAREGTWRRLLASWHRGAGLELADDDELDTTARFASSKGVDVWTRGSLSLLPSTSRTLTSANTNLRFALAGGLVWCSNGSDVSYSVDGSSWSAASATHTGTGPAATVVAIASDGSYVYVSDGTRVRRTLASGTAWDGAGTLLTVGRLGFAKGRIIAAGSGATKHVLYDVSSVAWLSVPSALYTSPLTDFGWTDFCEGRTCIYATGSTLDKSLIYRIPLKSDGTGLDAPVVAGELPDGELALSLTSYLGYVVIGTTLGFRLATQSDDGSLVVGPLVRTGQPCRCGEGQDRFVWFGWDDYDNTSTGLGRLDLSTFTSPLAPAYASDLMATASGDVTAVATFLNRRLFAVAGSGVWFEQEADRVASGEVVTGWITYGLTDAKIAVALSVRHQPLEGTITVEVSDGTTWTAAGSLSTNASTGDTVTLPEVASDRHAIRLTLARDVDDATNAPTITGATFHAIPVPVRSRTWIVPLLITEQVQTADMGTVYRDVNVDLEAITVLADGPRVLVPFQVGEESITAWVDDYEMVRTSPTADRTGWRGTLVVKLRTP